MMTLRKIFDTIYKYYPKDLQYSDQRYQKSLEYKRLLSVRQKHLNSSNGSHLKTQLEEIFPDYSIMDWTNIKLYNCYEFKILLYKNQSILDDDVELMKVLSGRRLDLCLYISILGDFYYFNILETKLTSSDNQWVFNTFHEYPDDLQVLLDTLKTFMESRKMEQISYELAKSVVPDIETELLGMGSVRVFNCLFTELINDF